MSQIQERMKKLGIKQVDMILELRERGNLFGMLYNREVRYCTEHKSWYTYHEGAWRKDEGAILVSEKIKDFVRLMILYCGEIVDDDLRKSYTAFVNKMGDRRMRDRILKDATGELRIKKLLWKADKSLIGQVDKQNMTVHRWFANKSCPGEYLYSRHSDIAAKVNALLGDSAGETAQTPTTQTLYRVQVGAYSKKANADAMLEKIKKAGFDTYMVQVDGLYKVQVGAYSKKSNADAMAAKLKASGFDTYITTKSGTAVSAGTQKKSVTELAKEVIAGKWGNGSDRKNRLTQAGYDYAAVQAKVNELMK